MEIRAIVVDTAGTTTDLEFIQQTLFPYSAKALTHFLTANQTNILVANCIRDVKAIALEPDASLTRVIEILQQWITEDKKATPLKTLQGLIWAEGYANGELTGHIFQDFIDEIVRIKQFNLRLYSFSSGSVEAQQQLFSHSDGGDLTIHFNGHFDTRTGNKLDKQAYCNIINTISLTPKQILFISDVVEELDAAEQAGMRTLQMVRPEQNSRVTHHQQIHNFTELKL